MFLVDTNSHMAKRGFFGNLFFDDAYQYTVAKYYGLKVVTMDRDFEKIKDLKVLFL